MRTEELRGTEELREMEPGSGWNGKYVENVNWRMFLNSSGHIEVRKSSQSVSVTFALGLR